MDGKNVGVVPIGEAIQKARDEGFDLVEISPGADPPVCRIMDFGKYRYEMSKKAQEAKKKQTHIQIKEIKLRPRTDVHDLEVKKKHIREFLADGDKVKVTVRFRGRENMHKDIGAEQLRKIVEDLADVAVAENMPTSEGPTMHVTLAAKKS